MAIEFNTKDFLNVVKERAPELESKLPNLIKGVQHLEEARIKAEEIIAELDDASIDDYVDMPPIDGMTLLNVMSLLDEKSQKKARVALAKAAGKASVNNNPAHIALEAIREKEYPTAKNYFHLRGHITKFITDMHTKYPAITNRDSIKNLVTRLNKENGITQRKK